MARYFKIGFYFQNFKAYYSILDKLQTKNAKNFARKTNFLFHVKRAAQPVAPEAVLGDPQGLSARLIFSGKVYHFVANKKTF